MDAVVLGLGGMGSAVAAHLSQRGRRVVGLEQFGPAHELGSSHGRTRVIRQAYYEHSSYVPLLLRAYELWRDLEGRAREALWVRTGGLMVGAAASELVAGSERSAREHGLALEFLDAAQIRARYPAFRPLDGEVGVYEALAGALFPEACVLAHLRWSAACGARLQFGTRVVGWSVRGEHVEVETEDEVIETQSLVITAGPWLGRMIERFRGCLRVERNVMHWFAPRTGSERLRVGALPLFMLSRAGQPVFYGFPEFPGEGVKVATHYTGDDTSPESLRRDVGDAEVREMRRLMETWIPDAAGEHLWSTACMYTNTPDLHFIVGRHPEHDNVVVAGGFSGHGFKFCSVIGEIVAQLVTQGRTAFAIDLFDPARFVPA